MDATKSQSNVSILLDAFGVDSSVLATSKNGKPIETSHADTSTISSTPLTDTDFDFLESCGNGKQSRKQTIALNGLKLVSTDSLSGQKSSQKQKKPSRPTRAEQPAIYEGISRGFAAQHLPQQPSKSAVTAGELEEQLKQIDLKTKQFWDGMMGTNTAKAPSPTNKDATKQGYEASRMAWNNSVMQNSGDKALVGAPYGNTQQSKENETCTTAIPKLPIDKPLGGYGRAPDDTKHSLTMTGRKRGQPKLFNQARHAKASFIPPTNPAREKKEAEMRKGGALFYEW